MTVEWGVFGVHRLRPNHTLNTGKSASHSLPHVRRLVTLKVPIFYFYFFLTAWGGGARPSHVVCQEMEIKYLP